MIGFLVRILKFCLKVGVVVAGVAVLISYARLSEFGDMRKDLVDRILGAYAGRISINGPAELNMSFPPSVTFEDVRIKNADWAKRPDMMKADRVIAEIDLIPLLRGDMAVPRLRMVGVDIIVEQRGDGKTNWDELNEFETAAGPANPAGIPAIIPQIGGAAVTVAGGTLTVLGQAATTTLSLAGATIGGLVPCL